MGILDLTVQVLNLSPGVTLDDLILFFSYCGTVENIELEISLNDEGQPRSALVTFKQPYAFQTALLLNSADLAGQPIRILPSKFFACSSHIVKLTNHSLTQACIAQNHMVQGIIPTKQAAVVQEMHFEGTKRLSVAVDEREKCRISEKGRELIYHRTGYNVVAAEQAAGDRATRITNGEHVSSDTAWFPAMFGKASKGISELSTSRKRNNPNSRKQK